MLARFFITAIPCHINKKDFQITLMSHSEEILNFFFMYIDYIYIVKFTVTDIGRKPRSLHMVRD